MLDIVKLALRITTAAYDTELNLLISSCIDEMEHLGVIVDMDDQGEPTSAQVQIAIVAYCKWQFGDNDEKDAWRGIYHEKLAQMKMMTGLTDWRDGTDGSEH